MRLEEDPPEETKIRDLEKQIGDERSKGKPVDALIEERKQPYDSWIARLDRELGVAKDPSERGKLQRQRERAIMQYGQPIAGAAHSQRSQ